MTGLAHLALCGLLAGLSPGVGLGSAFASPTPGASVQFSSRGLIAAGTPSPGGHALRVAPRRSASIGRAVRSPPSRESRRIRSAGKLLGRAWRLERQGRIAAAYEALRAPLPRLRPRRPRVWRRLELHRRWALSRVQRGLGLFAAAAQSLRTVTRMDPGGLLGARAAIARADDLRMAGRPLAAARAFHSLRLRFPAYPSPGRWMVCEAEALLLLGRNRAAATLLRRVALEHPLGPDGDQAVQLLALLPDPARRAASEAGGAELARLRRLGRGGAVAAARAGLRRLMDRRLLSPEDGALEEARLLMAVYRYREAVPLLRRLAGSARGAARGVARRLLPGALFRADRLSGYLRSAGSRAGPRGRARRIQALILLGRYAEAARGLDRRGDAQLVRRAYLWYRAGQLTRAERRLAALVRGPGARAARYWLAVVHARQGKGGARGELWRLASGPRLDWYALMARARLGAGPQEPAPRPVAPWTVADRDGEGLGRAPHKMRALARRLTRSPPAGAWRLEIAAHLRAAARLLGAGLREPAAWELRELVRRYLVVGLGGRRGRLLRPMTAAEAWAGVRDRAGARRLPDSARVGAGRGVGLPRLEALLYQVFRRLGSPYLANRFASRRLGRPRLTTPRPYAPLVRAVATRARIAPGRLWAVMAVESAFWPFVVSSAGAIGLLQIMPLTARRIAGAMPKPGFRLADLFRVESSLGMGGWYLGQLVRRFSGQFALAVASYNGGPHRLAVWGELKRKKCRIDEFVEEIPFRETRRYVKRVVALAARYAVALGEPYGDLLSLGLRPSSPGRVDF